MDSTIFTTCMLPLPLPLLFLSGGTVPPLVPVSLTDRLSLPLASPPLTAPPRTFPGPALLPPAFFSPSCLSWRFKVSPQPDSLANFPQQFRSSLAADAPGYRRKPGYYAVHYPSPQGQVPGAEFTLEDGTIAVFQGDPPSNPTSPSTPISPVYAAIPSDLAAIPTGKVFVQFSSGSAPDYQSQLTQAGYRIESVPEYAPQAAWLIPASGQIADGLKGLAALDQIPTVTSVEVQVLMERQSR